MERQRSLVIFKLHLGKAFSMDVNYQLSNCVYSSARQDNIVLDPSYNKLLSSNTKVILCIMIIQQWTKFCRNLIKAEKRKLPLESKKYMLLPM